MADNISLKENDYLSFLVDITSQYHRVPCVPFALNNVSQYSHCVPFALNNVSQYSHCVLGIERCLPVFSLCARTD